MGTVALLAVFSVLRAGAQVADPVLTVTSGTTSQTVTVTVTDSNASTILYTTDGSSPATSLSSATVASGGTVSVNMGAATLNVQAFDSSGNPGDLVTATYNSGGLITSSALHALALKADGSLWAFGNNASGQLGISSTAATSLPVQVPLSGLQPIVSITSVNIAYENGLPIQWELKYLGATGQNPNALAPVGNGLTLLQCYQQGIDPLGTQLEAWELQYFGTIGQNLITSPDGNGLTLLQDYQQGNDPTNYYSQGGVIITPTLTIVSGASQTGTSGVFLSAPLVVQVTGSSGQPLANAPVMFVATLGTGSLAPDTSGTWTASTYFQVNTGTNGNAQISFQQPFDAGFTSTIAATSGGIEADFTETALADTNPPAAPNNVTATVQGDGSIQVTWMDNSDNETGFTIQQSNDGGETWTTVGSTAADTTSFTVPATAAGTPGQSVIQVVANSPNGNTPSSSPSGGGGGGGGSGGDGGGAPELTPIPTINYAAIDISGSTANGNNVSLVALSGTGNNAAFGFADSSGTSCQVYTWANGAATFYQTVPILVTGSDSYGDSIFYNFPPSGLHPSGKVWGTASYLAPVEGEWDEQSDGFLCTSGTTITFVGGAPGQIWDSTQDTTQPWLDPNNGANWFVMNSCAGSAFCGYFPNESFWPTINYFDGQPDGTIEWMGEVSSSGTTTYFSRFWPAKVNRNGWAIGWNQTAGGWPPGSGGGPGKLWNGSALVNVNGTPVDINSQGYVISGRAGTGWLSQGGTATSISQLLPSAFQNEITGINPLMISDMNPSNNAYNIIFNGSSAATSGTTFLLNVSTSGTALSTIILPTNISIGNCKSINQNGIISAIGDPNGTGSQHALLLLPVQLTNKADPTVRNGANGNDKQIDLMQSSTGTDINAVAWITASDTTATPVATGVYPPRMPELVATSGSISGLTYCWKLQVTFHDKNGNPHRDFDTGDPNDSNSRPYLLTNPYTSPGSYTANTPDQVTIPATTNSADSPVNGWVQVTGSSAWNIYQDPDWKAALAQGFFGGDAELSLKILDSNGNTISPEQDFYFRIEGENPDPTTCKAFINANDNGYSFVYAIAKEETNNDGGREYYNNFMDNGGGGVTKTVAWLGHEGRPDWNDDTYYSRRQGKTVYTKGTGGYGLFQLTYREDIIRTRKNGTTYVETGDANYIMPRDWIWNWQSNTRQAVVDLNGHADYATTLYDYLFDNDSSIQSQSCPSSGSNQDVFTAYQGILICLNNGSDGFTPFKPNGKWTPWSFNITTGQWTFTGTYAIRVAGFIE